MRPDFGRNNAPAPRQRLHNRIKVRSDTIEDTPAVFRHPNLSRNQSQREGLPRERMYVAQYIFSADMLYDIYYIESLPIPHLTLFNP